MKKLMIIATVAGMTICSQAATWRWEISSSNIIKECGGTDGISDVTAYVFAAGQQESVFNQWYNEGNYGVTSLTGSLNSKTVTAGQVSVVSTGSEFTTSDTSGKPGFFVALIDDGGNLFVSATKTGAISVAELGTKLTISGGASTKELVTGATEYSGTGWYGSVPEPTSGLLLLLGMAGLALRRRRA